MKKTISILLIFLLLLAMLLHPLLTVKAAADGLSLWYTKILPALLPFAILADVLIGSNGFYLLVRFFYPLIRLLLPVSREGAFPLLAGFTFGFPMGSRICARMVNENLLDLDEASIIFIISNNISPIFITSYIVHEQLKLDALLPVTILLLYLPPLIYGRIMFLHMHRKNWQKESASRLKINFSIIDAGILNGFEILCKLGGYIMLFSILTRLLWYYCTQNILQLMLTAPLEITNGIAILTAFVHPQQLCYALVIALTSLGGICGIAQTLSMVSATALPMKRYILVKALLALCSGILAYLLFPLHI